MCGMMKMYFHLSCDAEVLLFENWVITKGENLAISCFLVFMIGVGYSAIEQALTCLRKFYTKKLIKSENIQSNSDQNDNNDEDPLIQNSNSNQNSNGNSDRNSSSKLRISKNTIYLNFPLKNGYLNIGYLAESVLLCFYYFYAYAMMLIFMTYQVHLCVALCVGLATGFFLITGWQRPIGRISPQGQVETVETNGDYHNCCT